MNPTYLRIDLVRQLRDVSNVAFVVGLPVAMYLVFGSSFAQDGVLAGRGDVQLYIMSAMAGYGAAVATTAIAGSAAVEQLQGWGRQLGLTPLRPPAFVAMKVAVAMIVSAAAVAAVYAAGVATGAHATEAWVWPVSFAITWLGSGMFALFGLAVAQVFRSETALGVASGALVLLAFFGNLFTPLSGTMLAIARWTPMYGYAGLIRYPQVEGCAVDGSGCDPLWLLLLSVVVWSAIFAGVAVWAVRRGRRRQ